MQFHQASKYKLTNLALMILIGGAVLLTLACMLANMRRLQYGAVLLYNNSIVKTVDTIGNCQRQVSQHYMHKITNL